MFDWSNNIGAIDTKMDRFVLGEKPSFRLMGLCSSYKLDWDTWIISIAKIESKETGVLLLFMTFSSPEIAVYFYKSTIRSCIEYCCHFWGGGSRCYLKMLDKLPKRICRTVNPSLATSLECLIHYQNVTWLSLFHRCFFGRYSSEPAQLLPLRYFRWWFTNYSDKLHDFSVTIRRCYKDIYVNSSVLFTARPWNSVPMECISLTYDLNVFKSKITPFTCRFFLNVFPLYFNLIVLLFSVIPCLVEAVQRCKE